VLLEGQFEVQVNHLLPFCAAGRIWRERCVLSLSLFSKEVIRVQIPEMWFDYVGASQYTRRFSSETQLSHLWATRKQYLLDV
jgi:hypothetical protein